MAELSPALCVRSSRPTPPCFGARHSPDVVVCNLCHVLVGSAGVAHLPFTSVIYKGVLSVSDAGLKKDPFRGGFGCGGGEDGGETDSELHGMFHISVCFFLLLGICYGLIPFMTMM